MKATELTKMSEAELESKLKELKEELFGLRFKHAINQLDNPHKIDVYKRQVIICAPHIA